MEVARAIAPIREIVMIANALATHGMEIQDRVITVAKRTAEPEEGLPQPAMILRSRIARVPGKTELLLPGREMVMVIKGRIHNEDPIP
jgi:hypothetical protein